MYSTPVRSDRDDDQYNQPVITKHPVTIKGRRWQAPTWIGAQAASLINRRSGGWKSFISLQYCGDTFRTHIEAKINRYIPVYLHQ